MRARRMRWTLLSVALGLGAALAPAPLAAAPDPAPDAQKSEAEAKRAFDAGRFQEAGEKYARAADAASAADRKAELAFQSGWAYFIAGNSRAARESLKAAFVARPTLDVVADFYSPDFVKLVRAVRTEVGGSTAPPADLAELKRTAREKLADGKAEEALYDLKRAESSQDPQIHRLLGDTYERLGRAPEADGARKRAAELERNLVTSGPIPPGGAGPPASGPGAPNAAAAAAPVLETGETALKNGDFRAAQTAASRAIELDPRSSEAHRLLADAALALGQEGDAEREATAALVLDSGNSRAEYALGRLAERQAKWNTAASHYRRALELSGKNVGAALGLGRSMEELKDRTAARIAYGRAIEIDPASAEAHNDFGVFLFRSDQADRAIEELMEAVRLAPGRAAVHENLGRAFRRRGKLREAERELAEASRLAPNETAVWTTLGQVRAEIKKPDEAAGAFRSALDLANPKSATLWNNLGVLRTRKGSFPGAVDAFRNALAQDAGFQPAKANLARAEQLYALERAGS
ncbi:MAG: tetratricopeptide repeat protein [Acidobacteria bacterium]|nr:tetratricopeptide repeat protein [Acidobacteriota bacterium]